MTHLEIHGHAEFTNTLATFRIFRQRLVKSIPGAEERFRNGMKIRFDSNSPNYEGGTSPTHPALGCIVATPSRQSTLTAIVMKTATMFALVMSVAVGVGVFSWLYTQWLDGESGPLGVGSIQGIVLLGTIVAAFAYLVRVCGRIAFGCFHLMRDAEERRQLTYLYLSLSKKDRIDESSRDIVLQALFSRSESGLLGMDSSPTLPSVSDIVKSGVRAGSRSQSQ